MLLIAVGTVKAATFVVANLTYEKIDDGTCRLVGHDTKALEIVVPETVTHEEHTYRVTEIGFKALSNPDLTSVTLPDGLTVIGESAFDDCRALSSVTIPGTVTKIEKSAFWGCFGLKSVVIPNSVTEVGEKAFSNCIFLSSVTLSEQLTVIKEQTFSNCPVLSSVTIPNSVTEIGGYAFGGCDGLTSLTIPAGVKEIGEAAFMFCRGLTSLTVSEGVTLIGEQAFENCVGLTSVTLPSSVKTIDTGAFKSCIHLNSVTLSEGVTEIGSIAFSGCSSLTSIAIPASITSIAGNAFYSCSGLTSIEVASDNNSYSSSDGVLFDKARKTLVIYPSGKRNSSYTVPDAVTAIGEGAFFDCGHLASVTISGSVTAIGNSAFQNCYVMKDIYCLAQTPPAISLSTFESYSATLHVPEGCMPAYKAAENWKNFKKIVEGGESAIDHLDVDSSIVYHAGILSLPDSDVPATVYVYTQDGKCVWTCPMAVGERACDLSPLAQGIYLVRVKTGNETACLKIVR